MVGNLNPNGGTAPKGHHIMPWLKKYMAPDIACIVRQYDDHPEGLQQVIPYNIYHTYIDDDYTLPSAYFFTMDPRPNACKNLKFDIRKFPTYHEDKSVFEVLQDAIDLGWVEFDCQSFWQLVDGKSGRWPETLQGVQP